ncbi:MAG: stage V sporulation protein D [Clostridia bacterium]|nr:stage V sporulation protein D [Clostridia bacterium]
MFILARLFYIQVVWGKELQSRAIDQWTRELPLVARRGVITDRNGVVLASNYQTYSVFIRGRSVTDANDVAKTLSSILDVDYDQLYSKIINTNNSVLTVKKQVGSQDIERLRQYNLQGVYYSPDYARTYPYGKSLSQVLGYTSYDGMGLTGIEKVYDEYLKGYDGEILYEADLVGKDIEGKNARYVPATNGLNVKLTIDYEIQSICDAVIEKAYNEYTPKSASVLVMNPQNGQILAMTQYPCYDLNELPRDDVKLLNKLGRCSLVVDSYEPGSTFKILTAAANIEEYLKGNPNAFSNDYVFNSSRYRYVDGKKIKCWSNHDNGKHSNENLAMALNNSCNPCFVDIALALGKEKMYEYIKAFGYGQCTGVDFQGEAIGMLLPESAVKNGDLARISFGQTIAVTPIQLACATASAVNGGKYFSPYFVSEISDEYGKVAEVIKEKFVRRVISEEASKILASYLEGVVENGSGKQAYIEGYKIGGKTGTAQKYENGVISQGKYVMSFIGFFPSNNPEYLALVIVDEPVGGQYGSTVAAPLVKEIFQGIINCKNIGKYC